MRHEARGISAGLLAVGYWPLDIDFVSCMTCKAFLKGRREALIHS
jgi:hypothetical protein